MSKYPFHISTQKNDEMNAHDLMVLVGGFASRAEADEFGKHIAEFLADSESGWADRVQ